MDATYRLIRDFIEKFEKYEVAINKRLDELESKLINVEKVDKPVEEPI